MTRSLVIGVAGGSCSGKTTLLQSAHSHLGAEKSAVLFQDSYYIDQSHRFDHDGGAVNFDHPEALDLDLLAEHLSLLRSGKTIEVPIYDFTTHSRKPESVSFAPKPVILLDGILILHHAGVRAQLDYSLFIECDELLRLQRRVERDVSERGRTSEGVSEQFARQVAPMHDQFVEASKEHAESVFCQDQYLAGEALDALLGFCETRIGES